MSRRLYRYLSAGADDSKRIRKSDVLSTLARGSWINILGLGATLLGLQATVGLLVAKTLTNATANPFLAGGAGSYNPVLALDVFLVQVRFPSHADSGMTHSGMIRLSAGTVHLCV